MSVRKRKWIAPNGEAKESWVVNYTDAAAPALCTTFCATSPRRSASAKIELSEIMTPRTRAGDRPAAASQWRGNPARISSKIRRRWHANSFGVGSGR
jgi:hypothetical protein